MRSMPWGLIGSNPFRRQTLNALKECSLTRTSSANYAIRRRLIFYVRSLGFRSNDDQARRRSSLSPQHKAIGRTGCISHPDFCKAVAPTSTRRGDFALLSCRHARRERHVVIAAKREPEQVDNPLAAPPVR